MVCVSNQYCSVAFHYGMVYMNVWLLLGFILFLKAEMHQQLVTKHPHDAQLLFNAGVECARNNMMEQASNYFSLAKEHATDNELQYKIMYNQINACAHQSRYEDALALCEDLYQRHPDDKRLPPKI